jgi:hypothetical protein
MAPPWKFLYLNCKWIIEDRGLRRVFHRAVKHPGNPLIRPSEPWEERRVYAFGSVIRTAAGYRLYYQTCSNGLEGEDKALVCVAESEDLVDWRKPALGIMPFAGRSDTNIVLKCSCPKPLYSPSVILDDDEDDPARRWKMLFWDAAVPGGPRGGCAAFSADGLHWRRQESRPLFTEPNDVLIAVKDTLGGFVCHQTLLLRDPSQDYPRDNLRGWRRVIGRRTSTDFINWSEPEVILQPDGDDPPDTQFYGLAAWPEDVGWIGLLWTYHAESQTSDVQLAWSHDGKLWRRPQERTPLIGPGAPGEFDSHMIFTASAPVRQGDELCVIYGGFDGPHDSHTRAAAIGLATIAEGVQS